jgi:hypothetical protein
MLAKCLFINPHPSTLPQSLVISADREALEALRDGIQEALDLPTHGAVGVELIELEKGTTVTYQIIPIPDEMLRAMKADEN